MKKNLPGSLNLLDSLVEASPDSTHPTAISKRPDLDLLRSMRSLRALVDRRNKKDEDEFRKIQVALNTIAAAAVKLLPTSEVRNGLGDEYAALYAKAKSRFNAVAKKGAARKN